MPVASADTPYFSQTATQTIAELQGGTATDPGLVPIEPSPLAQTASSSESTILPALSDIPSGLIIHGNRSEYKIALTFDLCQAEGDVSGFDAGIVRILNETQTPATFFLGGQWMRDHQEETRQLASIPFFELGNHSWSHRDFSAITPEEMTSEILLAQEMMYQTLGRQTNLFRLPYGTYTEESLNVIAENGLYAIQWDIVSGDPDPDIDAVRITNGVLQQIQPGSIVIMHANGRGWHTAEALPDIIQTLRQQGYTFVTISNLLGIEPYR